jgi:hypothetical protein
MIFPLIAALTFAAPATAPRIAAADLQADARVLRQALETLHPGLARYLGPAEVEAALAALDAEFSEDRTLAEAYLAVSRLTARVRCGHTYPNFVNQPKAVAQALFEGTPRLPFYFRWLEGRMVVTRTFAADTRLRPGAEVVAIDGVPAATVLSRLLPLVRGDGSNDSKRVSLLEVQGRGTYEAFDVHFPLLYPSAASRFQLQVRAPGASRVERIVVAAQTAGDRRSVQQASPGAAAADAPLWALEWPDAGTAVWRMPTWATYNSKWDWKQALARGFDELAARGAHTLVLDLRANEGGTDEVGRILLSHLATRDLRLREVVRRVRYRRVPDTLAPYLDTWDPSFKDWGPAAVEDSGGFYRLDDEDDAEGVVRPVRRPFTGRVFALTSAVNSSATFAFLQAAKQAGLATLVGQATGGNQRGTNGGAFFFLRLPHSRIEVDLPLIGYFPEGTPPDAGLDPDVAVASTARDIAAGRDVEMEAVREALRRDRAKPKR